MKPEDARMVDHRKLASAAGVAPAEALALLAVLHTHGMVDLKLAVYHEYRFGSFAHAFTGHTPGGQMPAALLEFGTGFPASPWKCPACEDEFPVRDLRFEIVAVREEQG